MNSLGSNLPFAGEGGVWNRRRRAIDNANRPGRLWRWRTQSYFLEGDELIEGFVPTGMKAHVSVLFAAVSSPWIAFAACFAPGLCGSSGHRRLQRGALHTRD